MTTLSFFKNSKACQVTLHASSLQVVYQKKNNKLVTGKNLLQVREKKFEPFTKKGTNIEKKENMVLILVIKFIFADFFFRWVFIFHLYLEVYLLNIIQEQF